MVEKSNFEEIKQYVKKMVSEISEIAEEDLKDDASFAEDLGVDSMMALEIVASIEKKYRIAIPESEIPNIRSLQNVYEIVQKLLKA